MYALEIQNLQKKFEGFSLDVSFSLPKGCVMGLIGTNGAGKSTTIKLVLDMLNKDGGVVKLFGKDHKDDLPSAKGLHLFVARHCPPFLFESPRKATRTLKQNRRGAQRQSRTPRNVPCTRLVEAGKRLMQTERQRRAYPRCSSSSCAWRKP